MSTAPPVERLIEDTARADSITDLSDDAKAGWGHQGDLVIENVDALITLSEKEARALRDVLIDRFAE